MLQIGCQINHNRMASSVDPDETAHELSHQDPYCWHRYLVLVCRAVGLRGLNFTTNLANSADDKLIFFLIFREIRLSYCMLIVFLESKLF